MASPTSCLSRPTLQFLRMRNFRPLLSRGLRSRPSQPRTPRPASLPQDGQGASPSPEGTQPQSLSTVLANTDASNNSLLAPVHIPEDPHAVLRSNHPSTSLLEQSGIVIQRQIEMMNIFLGFEQANRYVILSPQGEHIGYMAEHDGGIAKTMGRQWFRTHRAFMVHVFGRDGKEVLRFHRPFSWINTRIRVYDPVELASGLKTSGSTDVVQSSAVAEAVMNQQISSLKLEQMRVIGDAQSEWAPLRRKYNLFLAHELPQAQEMGTEAIPSDLSNRQQQQVKGQDHFAQFAYIDEPFLSWDFSLKNANDRLIGSVNRNWGGFGRELFTDQGIYALRMDAAGLEDEAQRNHTVSQSHQGERAYAETLGGSNGKYGMTLGGSNGKYGMTLDQRAVMLATAVTVDFDYFSRHSHSGGIIPMPLMMGGGSAAEGGAVAGGAAEAGAIGETVSGAGAIGVGRAGAGAAAGAGEGAIAGAGTMAGYEAMQRGMGRGESSGDVQSPQQQYPDPASPQSGYYESDPQSPQYGGGSGSPMPPEQGGQGQTGDVWGSGDSDPWAEGNPAGDGGEGGGIIEKLWNLFGGGD